MSQRARGRRHLLAGEHGIHGRPALRHWAPSRAGLFWIFINTKNPDENKGRPKKGLERQHHDDLGNDYQRRLCREIEESFLVPSDLMSGLVFGGVNIVLGGIHDIILRLFSDDPTSVGSYVTRFLRSRPSVASTSTAWALIENAKNGA